MSAKMQAFDVVIVGAGAAGMMCAIQAGSRGRSVALIDHGIKIGRKILISGGGRCNFTNIYAGPDNYVSSNPHFCKSALARYTPNDFIALVKKHRISFHEKKLGQLFCDKTSSSIVDMLVTECKRVGVEFFLGYHVQHVQAGERFLIQTAPGGFTCESLVIATGGLSVPQTGATGFGYDLARQHGLKVVQPKPALDGFTLTGAQVREFTELTGVSLDCTVTVNNVAFRENILFTHTGLSGPASLQASLYWESGSELSIDVFPDLDVFGWLLEARAQGVKTQLKNVLSERLPKRFAEKYCDLYLTNKPLSQLSPEQLKTAAARLHDWRIVPAGTRGFKGAEVTRGGVDTDELSSRTMECRKVPGLYFIGEVVDVTGWLGGYNFQWAWASGYAAGQCV